MTNKITDFEDLPEALIDQGWVVKFPTSRAVVAIPPDKTKAIVHYSKSQDRAALKNTITNLRRSGFIDRLKSHPPPMPDDPPYEGEDPTKPHTFLPKEPPTMPAPKQETMETAFAKLKDARTFAGLIADDIEKVDQQIEEALKVVDKLRDQRTKREAELSQANADLEKARATFDRLFEKEKV